MVLLFLDGHETACSTIALEDLEVVVRVILGLVHFHRDRVTLVMKLVEFHLLIHLNGLDLAFICSLDNVPLFICLNLHCHLLLFLDSLFSFKDVFLCLKVNLLEAEHDDDDTEHDERDHNNDPGGVPVIDCIDFDNLSCWLHKLLRLRDCHILVDCGLALDSLDLWVPDLPLSFNICII